MTTLKIKRLHPRAIMPRYATAGAACFDLHALEGASGRKSAVIRTGLAFEIPEGYALMIYSRSGMAFKQDIRLANCVGVIDSDYRGEVMVKLTKDDGNPEFHVNAGDRIAQAMLIPVPQVELVETDTLHDTARGAAGLGSTGA